MGIPPWKGKGNLMKLEQNADKNIYVQLADWIEDNILAGVFPEGSRIPSVANLSAGFKMNHITALKSLNILTEAGILYKKQGIGMFVAAGACEMIRGKRKEAFGDKFIVPAIKEAKKLAITEAELHEMIDRVMADVQRRGVEDE